MSKPKQEEATSTTPTIQPNGKTSSYSRTRLAARDGIGNAKSMLSLLDAICIDHAEDDKELDPTLLLRAVGKAQGVWSLSLRAAAEARRNPQFKNSFFLSA